MRRKFEEYVRNRWKHQVPSSAAYTGEPSAVPYPMVAALGLAGETGEVMEHLKKHYRDGKVPGNELRLELGDVLHYLTVIAHSYGWSLSDIMEANIEKLEKRDAEKKAA